MHAAIYKCNFAKIILLLYGNKALDELYDSTDYFYNHIKKLIKIEGKRYIGVYRTFKVAHTVGKGFAVISGLVGDEPGNHTFGVSKVYLFALGVYGGHMRIISVIGGEHIVVYRIPCVVAAGCL